MMIWSPMDEQVYDQKATGIIYGKLFPYIMEDFLTRLDSVSMMAINNLPVTVAIPAGTGSCVPIYSGIKPKGVSKSLAKTRETQRRKGGVDLEAISLLSGILTYLS